MAGTRLLRSFVSCCALLIGATAIAAEDPPPPVPPLNSPSTGFHAPGKFVWADFFTSDLETTRRFYGELFGWEWSWVDEAPGHRYAMFSADGKPVAGVVEVKRQSPERPYARWVYYGSVKDVDTATEVAMAGGGRTMLARREVPERGTLAVLADPEQAPFGVLHSSSGDPGDYRAELGEWIWVGLFAQDAEAASKFYADVFGYEVHERNRDSKVLDFVLSSTGYARAGIADLSQDSDAHPTWLAYVRVPALPAAVEKVRSLGGEVVYDPDPGKEGDALAIFEDPLGAPVGLLRWTYPDDGEAASSGTASGGAAP